MKTKYLLNNLGLLAAVTVTHSANAQFQGPSTGSTPYAVPMSPSIETISIATVDNTGPKADDLFTRIGTGVKNYGMVGIPDGLGAFDNDDGTFTVLMNHEIQATAGIVRAHGSVGSFVSQYVINKNTLAVVGAKDLITSVTTWNKATSTYNPPGPNAIGRLCSGDLPAVSAFQNGELGTFARIFMSGEEIGAEGRAFGHVVTGPEAGRSYELPRLGKFSWENAVAAPFAQDKTVVVGTDDTTPGEVYVYIGTKTSSGTEVAKAGLTNGLLYGVKVGTGLPQAEDRTNPFGLVKGGPAVAFSLVTMPNAGNVENVTGAQLQSAHTTDTTLNGQTDGNDGTTNFLRPEDCAWDTITNNKCYFATTDRYDGNKDGGGIGVGTQVGRSRLYVLEFADITNPLAGGVIRLLIDGTESLNMIDNIGVDFDGKITLVEDVGGQQHNGKLARFNPATGSIQMLARHDRARNGDIGMPSTAPFSQDEEFSGNIDITAIMETSILNSGGPNERWILMDDQQHYAIAGEKVEGGQLIAVHDVAPLNNVSVFRSGVVRDRRTPGRFVQDVTIRNDNSTTQAGSFHLVLDRLSQNVTLVNKTGDTANFAPLGRPYITITTAELAPGASATVTLQFNNPSNTRINYTTRVLNSVNP